MNKSLKVAHVLNLDNLEAPISLKFLPVYHIGFFAEVLKKII